MTQGSNSSLQFTFSCPLPNGLHARPSSQLAETANQFTADCSLTNLRNGLIANAKSVLGIIAADIRHGDRCVLVLNGSDKHAAQAALRRFVEETLPHCDVPLADASESSSQMKAPRSLRAAKLECIPGVPVSRGIAIGKVVVLRKITLPTSVASPASVQPERELGKVRDAVAGVRHRITERLKYAVTPVGTAVLQAGLAMASDVFLLQKLNQQVSEGKSAAQAIVDTGEFFIDLLGHSDSEYIRQRAADIEEICLQLLEEVGSVTPLASIQLSGPSVLAAETIAPQQLLQLDRHHLKALVLEHSATTSHAAILARSLGIPTLAGVRNARLVLTPGEEALVDAHRGFLVPRISAAVRRFYEREVETLKRRNESWAVQREKAAATLDGEQIEVGANVASGDEVILAFENGADGIGLFRTEMIFLGREEPPSEEEQYAIYSEAARVANGRPVIIRTFDVGGDKKAPYLNLPREENPFLGYRGIRIYSDHQELLQSQLRAILRASVHGVVQIMAPMVTSLEDVLHFKAAVSHAKQQLQDARQSFQPDIKIGIMIEVPAVAFLLDQLCREVDFFSIGTNDLAQYFFAADRGNSKVSSLYSVRHPAFLRFLDEIVEQIHLAGKWVGMCGEMAADHRNLPLLLGLGMNELSVPAAEVHGLKQDIARSHAQSARNVLDSALASRNDHEVDNSLTSQTSFALQQPLLTEELILLNSNSQSKEEVLEEMVNAFYICGRADDRPALEESLWAREMLSSTSLGYGFAIPHCKTDAVIANSICVLRLKKPIEWDSNQGERVSMVILLALRESDAGNMHLQIFSSLARKLINDDFRQQLLNLKSAAGIIEYLSEQLEIPSEAGAVLSAETRDAAISRKQA